MNAQQQFFQAAIRLSDIASERDRRIRYWTTNYGGNPPVYNRIKTQLVHLSTLHNLNVFDFYERP